MFRKRLSRCFIRILVPAFLLGTLGCGGESTDSLLRVWIMEPGGDQAREAIDRINDRFSAAHPDIELEVEFIAWKGAESKIKNALLGGIAPDVCELGNTWTPAFASGGALADLTDQLNAAAWKSDLFPAQAASAVKDGRFYGVPWYAGCRALIYRKDLLKDAGVSVPETWEQWVACAHAVQEKSGGKVYGIGIPGRSAHVYLPLIWSNGGQIMVQSEGVWEPAMTMPATLEALGFIRSLAVDEKVIPLAARIWDANDARRSFVDGSVAMTVDGPWAIPGMLEQNPSLEKNLGVALIPRSKLYATFAGGSHLVVFEQSKHKDKAWTYVSSLMDEQNLEEWCVAMGFFPGRKSLTKPVADKGPAYMAAFAEMMEHAKAYPPIPAWQKFEETHIFDTMVQQLFEGKTPEEAADWVDSEMKRIMEQG